MNPHIDLIKKVLEQYRGDDIYRAKSAFRNLTADQMQRQYGQSGKTCAEILAGYEAHEKKVNDALAWLASAATNTEED